MYTIVWALFVFLDAGIVVEDGFYIYKHHDPAGLVVIPIIHRLGMLSWSSES